MTLAFASVGGIATAGAAEASSTAPSSASGSHAGTFRADSASSAIWFPDVGSTDDPVTIAPAIWFPDSQPVSSVLTA